MINNTKYIEDVNLVSNMNLPFNLLVNTSILISGATGLIGTAFIDVIMNLNKTKNLNCKIYAIGRSIDKAKNRFAEYWDNSNFVFISQDINSKFEYKFDSLDYIIHMASNTHPKLYSLDPVGTITTNIIGTNNLLELAINNNIRRFMFVSTCEVYGENRKDVDLFDESYCGYIDCNTLRAGYPESKRCGESLCQAYKHKYSLDVVIPRLTRTYGPTILSTDSKAISQFLHKAVNKEDIILKSDGTQLYSYTYVFDVISGLLVTLLNGVSGEAYNISDSSSDITLRDLASLIANYVGKSVKFEIPDDTEKAGYSKATKSLLNGEKIKSLGWKPLYDIKNGIERTIDILKTL